MDRPTFLRSLLGSTALITLPPLELLGSAEQDRLAWTRDCHHIFVYDGFVRGFRFHEGAAVITSVKDRDELDLVREYANEHDPDAVAVYWQGHKLGYLAMGENLALANLIATACCYQHTWPIPLPSWSRGSNAIWPSISSFR